MQARKVAALSDIHGNIRALEAALEEVEREQHMLSRWPWKKGLPAATPIRLTSGCC